jgi:hypothetical protein
MSRCILSYIGYCGVFLIFFLSNVSFVTVMAKPKRLGQLSSIAIFSQKGQVIVLDDDSFESSTQASTGSTSGDWLVLMHNGIENYPDVSLKEII